MQPPNERDLRESIKNGIENLSRNSPNTSHAIDFPIQVFPPKLRETLENVSISYGVDKSFLSTSILFAYSLAIGKTHVVELKKGQFQAPSLFMVQVAIPSSNKSAALKFALSPIDDLELKLWKDYQTKKKLYDQWKETPKNERANLDQEEEPQLLQYILKDSTMEATCMVHNLNKRGIAYYRDELAGFFKDLNKYRKGSDMEAFLETWSGSGIKSNRTSKAPIFVSNAFISVGGTIQPAVLREMSRDFLKLGSGFIDRFLFVYPDIQKKAPYTDDEVDLSLVQAYKENLQKVLDFEYKEDSEWKWCPTVVEFTPPAKAKIVYWKNEINNPRCDSSIDLWKGIYGKFDSHLQRICLILHFIKWSYDMTEGREKISLETVEEALLINDFFISQTEKSISILSDVDPKIILEDHELKLYNALPDEFITSKAQTIAEKHGKNQSAFYIFLNKYPDLFKREKQGVWKKNKT